jgi:hypothetical protein
MFGRIVRLEVESDSKSEMLISTLKWPLLHMMAPSFIFSMCSLRMTLMSPVAVTNISPIDAASDIGMTRKPFMTASKARVG